MQNDIKFKYSFYKKIIMDKVSLHSVPWQDMSRLNFLGSLEKAIFEKTPIELQTRIILGRRLPYGDEKDGTHASLLFQMLDKGVIYRTDKEPGDWTNDYILWLADVGNYLAPFEVTEVEVIKAFEEVNQYLDGFGFVFAKVDHAWLFYYVSESFEIKIIISDY